jgi:hypothetical protein
MDDDRRRSIGDLARELLDLAESAPQSLAQRVAELTIREQAELALLLPADQRVELLLHAPKPMRLVRALPDADFFLTVRETGPEDAMPVLALASAQQILHLMDLESWRQDRFDADRCGAWVALLLESGEPTVRRFLKHADDEVLALLFQKWIRAEQMEYEDGADIHGHGQSEAGNEQGFMTPDGEYRFSPSIPEHAAAIGKLLRLFYQEQPDRYQQAIWTARWELTSELEEGALRWRQSRLEEHGFPDWDEALSTYAPPAGVRVHPTPPEPSDPDGLAGSRILLRILPAHGPIAAAINMLEDNVRERVLHETISLANHLLIADGCDTGDPAAHRAVLEKAAGYVGIALAKRGAHDPVSAALTISGVPVMELFREGHDEAVQLQRRAHQLSGKGWAAGHGRALELLDSPILERVRSLLLPRPLYVELDEEMSAGRVRDFASNDELEETRVSLEMAEFIGRLLVEGLGLDMERLIAEAGPPRFSTVLLTLLAWHAGEGELRSDPLPPERLEAFLSGGANLAGKTFAKLAEELAERLDLGGRQRALMQAFGRFCLKKLAEECESADPDYSSCFLLSG